MAAKILLAEVKEISPEIIISLGQAEGRKAITPEKIAINLDSARIPDNAGELRVNQVIIKEGADGYFSTLPIEKMVEDQRVRARKRNFSVCWGISL